MSNLDHKPAAPARQGHCEERIFSTLWERLVNVPLVVLSENEPEVEKLYLILPNWDKPITQRVATVCASIVCWLGTNIGLHFMQEAQRINKYAYADNKRDLGISYLAAWAIQNRRKGCVSEGFRTLELIMREPEHYSNSQFARLNAPSINANDLEVADHLMEWLGSEEGIAFVAECELEIEKEKIRENIRWHTQCDDIKTNPNRQKIIESLINDLVRLGDKTQLELVL